MHRRFVFTTRFLLTLAVCLGIGGVAASALAQTPSGATSPPFQVGEPVTDSTTALVLQTGEARLDVPIEQYQQGLQMATRGRPVQGEQAEQAHRQVIRRYAGRFALENAEAMNQIEADTALVTERVAEQRAQFPDSAAYADALEQQGLTADSLRSLIARGVRMQQFQQQIADSVEAPSPEEVQAYAEEKGQIGAQHILLQVEPGSSASVVDSIRAQASALIDSAEAGADFARLAREYSEGPSASDGGDLGTFSRERMVEPFANAAFTLADSGDVYPEPVRTRFGFHVIRLTQPMQPLAEEEARSAVLQTRQREAVEREVERLMQDVTVRINPDVVPVSMAAAE
jgi:peptidyl-prolyl cis-trans isomerase C